MIMKNNSVIIELKDVWKIYRMGKVDVYALRNVSIKIKKGELVAIQGPSGAGKSTLMNIIGCLDVPTKGKLFLDGIDVTTMHESDLATVRGKKIGFVFQQFNLVPYLNALENVMLPMIFQAVPKKERIKRAKELLKIVGLEERMYHKPNELSGGQQQRIAIARALANDPEVILADEPTGNLDSKTGLMIMNFFKELNKKFKKTVIFVTHDSNIAKMAERIIYIKDGKIVNKI